MAQLEVTTQNFPLTKAIEKHIEKKIERLCRHFDHIINCRITMKIEHLDAVVEGNVNVRKHHFVAISKHKDMYHAIDATVDKLDRQIVKHKEKLQP